MGAALSEPSTMIDLQFDVEELSQTETKRDYLGAGLCPPSGRDPVPGDHGGGGDPGDRCCVLAGHVEDHDGGAVVNLSVR